jgi:hypothetical protein
VKLPKHVTLNISHQPHLAVYETVEEWLSTDFADVTPEDRAEMLTTGEVWVVQWYPDTPVGFCAVAAASLERALALANG